VRGVRVGVVVVVEGLRGFGWGVGGVFVREGFRVCSGLVLGIRDLVGESRVAGREVGVGVL